MSRPLRLDIQGLRAIAVLAVVICHMNRDWLPGGYLGVDVFFVISGYVVTHSIVSQGAGVNLRAFYAARIRRILPLYIVVLAAVTLVSAVLLLPKDFDIYQKSAQKAVQFSSNVFFGSYGDYFAPDTKASPLLHTWSLAVEMQFYLLLPLALKLMRPCHWKPFILTLAILFLGVAQFLGIQAENKQWIYYSLLTRAPELLMGALLALQSESFTARTKRILGIFGISLLALAFIVIDETRFTPISAMLASAGAGAIIASEAQIRGVAKMLCSPAMITIGALSYSIYLWHWPILAWVRYFEPDWTWHFPYIVFYIVLVYVLSWISWHLLEEPMRKKVAGMPDLARWSSLAGFGAGVALLAPAVNAAIPSPEKGLQRYADPDTICHGKVLDSCQRGEHTGKPILMIGDSHAAQLNIGMDRFGREQHWSIRVLTASSCIPIPEFNHRKLPVWAQESCQRQIAAVSKIAPEYRQIVLGGMWSYQLEDPDFIRQLTRFLHQSTLHRQEVIVLGDIPHFASEPQRLYRLTQLGFAPPAIRRKSNQAANEKIRILTLQFPNAHWLDMGQLAFLKSAPFDKHGRLIYADSHHLNEVGSSQFGAAASGPLQTILDNHEP